MKKTLCGLIMMGFLPSVAKGSENYSFPVETNLSENQRNYFIDDTSLGILTPILFKTYNKKNIGSYEFTSFGTVLANILVQADKNPKNYIVSNEEAKSFLREKGLKEEITDNMIYFHRSLGGIKEYKIKAPILGRVLHQAFGEYLSDYNPFDMFKVMEIILRQMDSNKDLKISESEFKSYAKDNPLRKSYKDIEI